MICKTCGETMIGDGFTTALHCPSVDAWDLEPDADPAHCRDRVQELEDFVRAVIRYAGNAGDDYLADKARAVLDQSAANPYP
jgi:hypothetical protein